MLEYINIYGDTLNNFSLKVESNLGILGQRDSGKEEIIFYTLLLKKPKKGKILLNGNEIKEDNVNGIRWKEISAVFYNPYSMFNPIYNIASHFAEIVMSHDIGDYNFAVDIAKEFIKILGLDSSVLEKFSYQLTPLEAKKVSLALATFLEPKYVLIDDIEFGINDNGRAVVINSIIDLESILSSKFIVLDNDPAVISRVSDEFVVLYKGKIIERGSNVSEVYHPYTLDLLRGEISINYLGIGCPYSDNCRYSSLKCKEKEPEEIKVGNNYVKCLLYSWLK
ncbi:ATP-binding cassette domain-containing protein [Acidianus infernus]|uniref:ATP-binding cassette domain-containing protein n=1 Tax=Acidianus infernus TaxID=12915 RepID=A0A6A9QE40_ACIIN|nr:ATP-binding cassette domain-containing protein [Acidianus infernus]MUM65522.1 ATP-binding cassette domain-containing protein [Acidianus infernus]